jgi:hypothetical protein
LSPEQRHVANDLWVSVKDDISATKDKPFGKATGVEEAVLRLKSDTDLSDWMMSKRKKYQESSSSHSNAMWWSSQDHSILATFFQLRSLMAPLRWHLMDNQLIALLRTATWLHLCFRIESEI